MTAYTIATGITRYFDDDTWFIAGQGGVRTGGDTYTINGGTLIIDTDVRYCAAATTTTGPIASVTISTTLGGIFRIDGSNTRLIPFDTGTGNVPAMGTTISQGGVTGRLCGVWSAINVAPIPTGSAMPTSGFIKVCRKAGGNFDAGVLTGIGANATGLDIPGWIEVSADEAAATNLTVPRLGQWIVRGDWFGLGTTNGSRGQLINLPSSGQNLWLPGVWIETSAGSDTYEFWPSMNNLTTTSSPVAVAGGGWTTTNQGTDARSRHVQTIAGQIRIGSDGTNNIGHLPPTGCKIRIPNVILVTNTTAARGVSTYPTITLANRMETVVTGGGVIDVENAIGHWYMNCSQAFSTRFVNSAFSDQMILSEIASPLDLNNCHVSSLANADTLALSIGLCFAGGTIQNSTFGRSGVIGSGDNSVGIANSIGLTIQNCWFFQGTLRTNAALGFGLSLSQCDNFTINSCLFTSGIALTTVTDTSINNCSSIDRQIGTTNATNPAFAVTIQTKCNNITIDGWNFGVPGATTNVHPYNGLVNITVSDNIKVRNIGTAASPLNGGSVNIMRTGIFDGGTNSNIEIKRCYIINTNQMPYSASVSANTSPTNATTGVLIENFWGDTDVAQTTATLNTLVKGSRWITSTAAEVACYGSHFREYFISTTAGVLAILMNEKTTVEPSASSYSILAGSPSFTSSGTLAMRTNGDQIEWTTPYFIIGYTGFATTEPILTGVAQQNILLEFDIDNGSGFSGSYSKFLQTKLTGGGSSGSANVTMANTTGVETGDSIYGTGIAAGATVQTIVNGTTVTVAPVNTGTVSGNIRFSRLRLATITSSTSGYRIKLRATAQATDATTVLQHIQVPMVTNATSQLVQYPLDVVNASLIISGLQPNSEVRVYRVSDEVEIAGSENTGTTFTYDYTWSGTNTDVFIRIHHLNYQWLTYNVTLGNSNVTIPVVQIADRQYANL